MKSDIELKKIDERFWLYWGLAPKETSKYRAGLKALDFIHSAVEEAYKDGFEHAIGRKLDVGVFQGGAGLGNKATK